MVQYIYGYHPVLMALEPDSLVKAKKVFLLEKKYPEVVTKLKQLDLPYEFMSLEKMNNLLQTTKHQGIFLAVKSYRYFSIEELFTKKWNAKFGRLLICDKITDPHNFGSMLRIAAGNDFDGVVILSRNQAQVNSIVAKAAAGALSVVKIYQVNNLSTTINYLKQKKFWILAADKNDQAQAYQDLKYDFNLALIIGNEGEGVSHNLLKQSDYHVVINMSDKIESFNASVACGIIANNIYLKTQEFNTEKS